jgi:DNA-binding transcriptional LysR family regulator
LATLPQYDNEHTPGPIKPIERIVEFRHLKYFLAVAEELSLSRAAKRLFISQPPLTRQIRQLEDELGVQLFNRTNKGVELTHAGTHFKAEAERLLSLADQSIDRTRLAQSGELGRLEIGIFGSATFSIIPAMLHQFRTLYPKVEISLNTLSKTEQITALRDDRLTIGFNRLYPQAADMVIEKVLSERIVLATHSDHPFARKSRIAFKSLANEPLILFPNKARPSMADEVIALCRNAGFTPNVIQETEDVVTSIALVSLGFGICCVPESATNLQLPNVTYVPLCSPTPTIDFDCIYRRHDQSPILHAFLGIVRDYSKRYKNRKQA